MKGSGGKLGVEGGLARSEMKVKARGRRDSSGENWKGGRTDVKEEDEGTKDVLSGGE